MQRNANKVESENDERVTMQNKTCFNEKKAVAEEWIHKFEMKEVEAASQWNNASCEFWRQKS